MKLKYLILVLSVGAVGAGGCSKSDTAQAPSVAGTDSASVRAWLTGGGSKSWKLQYLRPFTSNNGGPVYDSTARALPCITDDVWTFRNDGTIDVNRNGTGLAVDSATGKGSCTGAAQSYTGATWIFQPDYKAGDRLGYLYLHVGNAGSQGPIQTLRFFVDDRSAADPSLLSLEGDNGNGLYSASPYNAVFQFR